MNLAKLIVAAAALTTLAACDTQQAVKQTLDLKQVKGLEDCTYYMVDPGGTASIMQVIRCPNSTTSSSYRVGKTRMSTVIIDGVEYVRRAD